MDIIFEHFTCDATILTPNRRLAATLLKKHHQHQIDQGESSWKSLDILPYVSWIGRLWQSLTLNPTIDTPLLLSSGEEEALWEDILRKSPQNDALLQISETATLAKAAFDILKQWRVNLDHPKLLNTEDSLTFLQWARSFEKICEEKFSCGASRISQILMQHIDSLELPKKLIVIGFTEITPEQKFLFDACESRSTKITMVENFVKKTLIFSEKRLSLPDTEKEIETMARFAKTKSKEGLIGCIVPHLEVLRDQVLQIFTDVFNEESHLFNISVGKKLINYPVIQTAIQLLHITSNTMSLDTFRYILRSPFLGDAEYEYHARAKFDHRLYQENITRDILNKILDPHTKICLGTFCPRLYQRLLAFRETFKTCEKYHSPDEWSHIFISLLKTLGWPGERSLNSHEYQVVQRFLNLLNEFREWHRVLPSQTYIEALHYLTRLANSTVFQPESSDAPVQILGMLEAADIPFDYIWVMGLDDTAWPPSPKPNPFIPRDLQRKLHMPHANAERELNYSVRLLQQLKRSTHQIIFSHALKNEDAELRVSALIEEIEETSLEDLSMAEHISHAIKIFQHKQCESLQDENGGSLQEHEKISHGINILKQQAACPFKAFAEIRLHARPIDAPGLGLSPQNRGIILHKALELTWKQLENSEQLTALSDQALKNILNECIETAIHDVTKENISEIRYLSLEVIRLQQMLWKWLQYEKNRSPFKVIAREEKRDLQIGPLQFNVRVDRIDELPDGSHFLIDYKTSKNNHIRYWFSDRMDEPQLPLYCLTNPQDITSIAFAEIHASENLLKGVSKNKWDMPLMKMLEEVTYTDHKNWETQIQSWQNNLEKLSHDFYQGIATVDPKHPIDTCQYCHLKPLCRIQELSHDF